MGDKRIQNIKTAKWQVRWDWAACKTRDERQPDSGYALDGGQNEKHSHGTHDGNSDKREKR
jgi:hypothetical protein